MSEITPEEEQALVDLRASLLRARPPTLRPDQGDEALQQHKVVAATVQRASRLHRSANDNETRAWVRYVVDFFPEGRNADADARALWKGWRCSLLKDDAPLVPVTHGSSELHWARDDDGLPYLNLEDVWLDYEHSVDRFLDHLRANPERRQRALSRWGKTRVAIRSVLGANSATAMRPDEPDVGASWNASVATSSTRFER